MEEHLNKNPNRRNSINEFEVSAIKDMQIKISEKY